MSAPHPVHSTQVPSDPAASIPASGAPTTTPQAAGAPASAQAKAPKEKKPKKNAGDLAQGMAALELDPRPEYIASRNALFEQLKKEADEQLASQSFGALTPFWLSRRNAGTGHRDRCPDEC